MKGERLIHTEFTWKAHIAYQNLTRHPPRGYRFNPESGNESKVISMASRFRFAYSFLFAIDRLVPVHLLRAYWNLHRQPPSEAVLTYAVNHLVLRDEPWVLELPCEHVTNVVGGFRHWRRFKGLIRRVLTAQNCRKIIVNIEASAKALEASLGTGLAAKTTLVRWAVPKKRFAKSFDNTRVRLLFVNSANIPGQFDAKGGKEALEAFFLLRERYPNVEMVVRSDMPRSMKKLCEHVQNLRVIDRAIPWEELGREFATADIFLLPSHLTPLTAFLDAMSYELPVVTTDAWGNPEIVEDGTTGLLVHDSKLARHYESMLPRFFVPPPGSPEYRYIIEETNQDMVHGLVQRLSLLIENPVCRRRLGRAGRLVVEEGKFSMGQRNCALKRVLDEATSLAVEEHGTV